MKFVYLLAASILASPTPQAPTTTPAPPPATGGGILNTLLSAVATGIGNSGINIGGIDVGRALASAVTGGAVAGAINGATGATPPTGATGATGAAGQPQSLLALTPAQIPNAATNIAAMMTGTAMGMAQSLAGKSVSQQQFTQMLSAAIQDPNMAPMLAMAAQIPATGM